MRKSQTENRIDDLTCEFQIKKVDKEFQFAFQLSEPIVLPKQEMIGIFIQLKQLVNQHGENVLTMIEDTVENSIKTKLRQQEAFFEDQIDTEFVEERYDNPVMLGPEHGVEEVEPDKVN